MSEARITGPDFIRPDNDVLPELVRIEGDDIVIRITPSALAFGTEHCPLLETFDEKTNWFPQGEGHQPSGVA